MARRGAARAGGGSRRMAVELAGAGADPRRVRRYVRSTRPRARPRPRRAQKSIRVLFRDELQRIIVFGLLRTHRDHGLWKKNDRGAKNVPRKKIAPPEAALGVVFGAGNSDPRTFFRPADIFWHARARNGPNTMIHRRLAGNSTLMGFCDARAESSDLA